MAVTADINQKSMGMGNTLLVAFHSPSHEFSKNRFEGFLSEAHPLRYCVGFDVGLAVIGIGHQGMGEGVAETCGIQVQLHEGAEFSKLRREADELTECELGLPTRSGENGAVPGRIVDEADLGLPEAFGVNAFLKDANPGNAFNEDVESSPAECLVFQNSSQPEGGVDGGVRVVVGFPSRGELREAQELVARQNLLNQGAIAALEYVKGNDACRQENHIGEWKQGNGAEVLWLH